VRVVRIFFFSFFFFLFSFFSFHLFFFFFSFFFFRTDYMIPQPLTVTSEHIRFLRFSFSVLHFLVVGSVR